MGLELRAGVPWLGIATIALLVLLPHCLATLVALAVLMVLAQFSGVGAAWPAFAWGRA